MLRNGEEQLVESIDPSRKRHRLAEQTVAVHHMPGSKHAVVPHTDPINSGDANRPVNLLGQPILCKETSWPTGRKIDILVDAYDRRVARVF